MWKQKVIHKKLSEFIPTSNQLQSSNIPEFTLVVYSTMLDGLIQILDGELPSCYRLYKPVAGGQTS